MARRSSVFAGLSIAMLTAGLPFVIVGLFWMLEWRFGQETTDVLVFNASYIVTRLIAYLLGASIAWVAWPLESKKRMAVAGAIAGACFVGLVEFWDRWLRSLYQTPWGDPSWLEVLLLFFLGAGFGLLSRKLAFWRSRSIREA